MPIKIYADDERFSSEEDSDHPDIGSSCDIVEELLVPLEACGGDDHEAEQQRIDSQSLSDDSQTSEPETPPAVVKLNRQRKQINYAELSQGDDDELETEDLQSESGNAILRPPEHRTGATSNGGKWSRQPCKNRTGDVQYLCRKCGNKLKSMRNIRDHISTHTGERPFSCRMCKKKFTRSINLLASSSCCSFWDCMRFLKARIWKNRSEIPAKNFI